MKSFQSSLKRVAVLCLMLAQLCVGATAEESWKLALPGWNYQFPQDHGVHSDFQTEWWYFIGNLRDEKGGSWGYQITFFRQGLSRQQSQELSRFIVRDLKFAHFAVSDLSGGRFRFFQKTSRGAFGEAGFGAGNAGALAWIDEWRLESKGPNAFALKGAADGVNLELDLRSEKPPVIHGKEGISQKAEGIGRASHYYSLTRLATSGWLTVDGKRLRVEGASWFDHEWATNQLAANQVGWNWFSVQLQDGSELMLYQMRCADGSVDPSSSGTLVEADGTVVSLQRDDYRLTPVKWWKSAASGARYPVGWRMEVPSQKISAEVSTPLESQELVLSPIAYWEGAIRVQGQRDGRKISGSGYMELTGYSGPLVGIRASE